MFRLILMEPIEVLILPILAICIFLFISFFYELVTNE